MSVREQIEPNPTRIAITVPSRAAGIAAEPSHEYLSFRLGAEEYGIDILNVQEIRAYELPTRLAGAPDFVNGVANLRGVIVPIVDLRLKLGLERASYDHLTVSVILNVGQRVVGVVVDAVSDVVELRPQQIRPAPEFGGAFDARYITGIGCLEHDGVRRMLILVDIERLVAGFERATVDSAC